MRASPISNLKRWIRTQLLRLIKKLAHSNLVQSIVWGRNETQSLIPLDMFADSKGNRFQRLKGWRASIVPHYTRALEAQPERPRAKAEDIMNAQSAVTSMEDFIQIYGYSIKGMSILELGCHGGAHACAMVDLGALHVDGIDIPQYGVRQNPGKIENNKNIEQQSEWLHLLREETIHHYEAKYQCRIKEKLDLYDLDVSNLKKLESYDIIASWQTLEHITAPQKAFTNMFNALKSNGICFHVYNPFFCLTGGHSLCTLDFPYGHVRLGKSDFEEYIKTYRPEETGIATAFYNQSLNRMTLLDLKNFVLKAGFEIVELIPWPYKYDLGSVDEEILAQSKALYTNISLSDLLSRAVWILLRKPHPI